MISVSVVGAPGRLGREIVKALALDSQFVLVGAVGRSQSGRDAGEVAGIETLGVEVESDLTQSLQKSAPDVVVDVSIPAVVKSNALTCLAAKIPLVIGATGLSEPDLAELDAAAKQNQIPVLIAPNFAIGAILMMRFAEQAAKYFDSAEILEFHHEKKLDAPSGTAFKTALLMRESRGKDFVRVGGDDQNAPGARGGEIGGVGIHSVRLPGFLAHQEVVFGLLGQTLTIRHDALSRECYLPGVLLSIRKVRELGAGVTFGLEKVL